MSENSKNDHVDLNEILQSALCEFDEPNDRKKVKEEGDQGKDVDLDGLLESISNEHFGNGGLGKLSTSSEKKRGIDVESIVKSINGINEKEEDMMDGDMEKKIKETLSLFERGDDAASVSDEDAKAMMDEIVKMMQQMNPEDNGSSDQGNDFLLNGVEKLMETLLSPKLLYEPMKQLSDNYPSWLEKNKELKDTTEYKQVQQQFHYSRKICTMYEGGNYNTEELIEVMKQMQECGQPPQEVLDQLSVDSSNLTGDMDLGQLPSCPTQ